MYLDPLVNIQMSKSRQKDALRDGARAHLLQASRRQQPKGPSRLRRLLDQVSWRRARTDPTPSFRFRDTH